MENFTGFYNHLEKLISFRSVKQSAKKDMPFGEGVYRAYEFFMNLAKEFGFTTINYDNYIGEIVLGEGQELGIIGHLDVVPEGSGWNTDPYKMTLIGDTLYARGLCDDKAPMLLLLYILKELKDSGIKLTKKIRFIVGCDEESDWQDIEYFKTKSTFPKYGISPDGNFPVSYAEKGINKIIFTLPTLKNFYDIKGGTVFNAVCGYCTCKATNQGINKELLKKYGLNLIEGNVIESIGKSCHGSKPELGKNAIEPLFKYFLEMGENVSSVVDNLFLDKLGLKKISTPQGNVTFSPNIISESEEKITIECDCRVPAPKTLDDLIKYFDKFNLEYKAIMHRAPLYVSKDSPLVKTLLSTYTEITGEKATPISQSGGTFAYVFEKGCAFGPEFENQPSSIHEANERISLSSLETLYNIYKKAIFSLATSKDFE